MTLRNLLFGVLATLSLLLVGIAGMSANEAWRQLKIAEEVEDSNRDADMLLRASAHLIGERDLIRVALAAPGSVSRDRLDVIRDRRAETGRLVEKALDFIAEERVFEGRERAIAETAESFEQLAGLRRQADNIIASGESDFSFTRQWWDGLSGLVGRLEMLRQASSREANEASAVSATYSMLKHFSLVTTDYAGREQSTLAGYIADDLPLPPGELQNLFGYRGQIDLAWGALREAVSASEIQALGTAATQVEASFIGAFGEARKSVLSAGIYAQSYPVDVRSWLRSAETANNTLNKLQEALVEANATHMEELGEAAAARLTVLAVFLAFGVAVGLLSVLVVARRVVAPLQGMTAAMTRLAEGDMEIEIPAAGRRDEIGRMALAVLIFKDNAIEKQRLEDEQAASRRRAEEEKRQAMNEMADRFEQQVKEVVDGVSSSATEMQATAQQMSATAEEATRQSANVATASEQATANVQMVAATAEELSASIDEIG
ncbi:MAG: HAMP domain-containing protein, partial [Alphaproteobacteria bacterium]|nr:HAMP domain-containing protein [Alphaproteobacteria bacterium]